MLPEEKLREFNVMFATPCYISAVSMNYVVSMFKLAGFCERIGLRYDLRMHSQSLITRARNVMLIDLLQDDTFTHIFWIDSDIAFRPQLVARLLLSDHDVVASVYPLKDYKWPADGIPAGMTKEEFDLRYTEYPFNPIGFGKERVSKYVDQDGFVEVAEAPTGFMCIKRDVFFKMMNHYPDLNYVPDGPPNNPKAHLYWRFFDTMIDPDSRRFLSEDYAFCRRWRDMGGKVFADVLGKLDHLGQNTFHGNLLESLKIKDRW